MSTSKSFEMCMPLNSAYPYRIYYFFTITSYNWLGHILSHTYIDPIGIYDNTSSVE